MSRTRPSPFRRPIRAAVLALAVGLLAACGEEPPVVIGAILPLSGPGISVGVDIRDGLALGVEEVNERGGINGRPLVLAVEDGAGDEEASRAAWEAIVSGASGGDDPLVVLAGTSALSLSLKPLAEEQNRLLVGLVATAPALTENARSVYRYWPTAEQELPVLTSVLPRDAQTLVVYYLDDAYGNAVFDRTKARLAETDMRIAGVAFPLAVTDFTTLVSAASQGDAVLVVGFAPHIRGVLGALEAQGYDGPIAATTTATLPEVVSDPAADGVHVVAPAIFNRNFVFADEIRVRYEARHGKPFNHYVANGYDIIVMLAGLLDGRVADERTLRAQLESGFRYSGLFGNVSLASGARDIDFPLFPARIRKGELVYR